MELMTGYKHITLLQIVSNVWLYVKICCNSLLKSYFTFKVRYSKFQPSTHIGSILFIMTFGSKNGDMG